MLKGFFDVLGPFILFFVFILLLLLLISKPVVGGPIFTVLVMGAIYIIYQGNEDNKKLQQEREFQLREQQDELEREGYSLSNISYNNLSNQGITISESGDNIALLQELSFFEINFKELLKAEIIEDGISITTTSRRGQVGGALLGGVFAGGVGAVIGGLSSQKTNDDQVKNIQLQITVNDEKSPVKSIDFLVLDDYISKSSPMYQNYYNDANYWYNVIEVLIDKADREEQDQNKKEFNNGDEKNDSSSQGSVADELRKLNDLTKEGVISQAEFDKEKDKILSRKY
ncbi:SHOCT domain-containing protein [Salisediminibacterium halotolerans]|uniref:SHOCT domain-containing protein n=1 Tax=Salisediminibacterium halotolerans TaxID=517425 RepID=UPI000EAED089|nr:SHOCT domain-containing protein [Salisediminibacterium halotolerans]RLJ72206.1 hypothetical protein BCL39_2098 [Actinophytocola xinjiangensis]RPE85419.1 hypothetical protein EDD67_2233 [Salisediminibacterium halotolerans]TWG33376.1 hypothetical protein BCL52_2095 [Salisediminibacterium halotolerans]GEL07094.1 hypothetical protein SHA02_05100 [Salisediminibacterium halotolerans]